MALQTSHALINVDSATFTGTSYLPGGSGYYHNSGCSEFQLTTVRESEAGSGTMTITIEEWVPPAGQFFPLEDGAGNAVTVLQYAADETDAAGERQLVRIGVGVVADADQVLAIAGSESNWYDYRLPKYFRLKLVEAGTSSVMSLYGVLYRD